MTLSKLRKNNTKKQRTVKHFSLYSIPKRTEPAKEDESEANTAKECKNLDLNCDAWVAYGISYGTNYCKNDDGTWNADAGEVGQ